MSLLTLKGISQVFGLAMFTVFIIGCGNVEFAEVDLESQKLQQIDPDR
ncbi:MAG: hypothetical protein HRT45_18645, partial [Bdellovibrionales bacterium]|nr:hypothetical protein [Bdellovibrionales bacterium]